METAAPKPVHVISLQVNNVKRIKAAYVVPDPANPLVLIGGANDQGKSSLLDSMVAVLGGKDASPAVPVRKGLKKGSVVLDLGELTATLRFTASGGRELIVEDKEGNRLPSPQAVMDRLTGKVGFDAEDFIRRRPDDQLAILRKIVGIDFKPLNDRKTALYDQRTAANSTVRTLETQLAAAPNPTDAPAELVDTTAVLAEIQKAQEHNKGQAGWADSLRIKKRQLELAEQDFLVKVSAHETATMEIARLERLLQEARDALPSKLAAVEEARKEVESAKAAVAHDTEKVETFPLQDVAGLQAKLAGADAANTKFRQAASRKTATEALRSAQAKAQSLDNAVQEIDAEKERLMTSAKFPVAGLSFTEEGIFFDGIPFSQASSSTKRRVSVAIGAALNPTLRVMVVKDGSLLDLKSMEQLRELAREHNLQVWVEVVTSGPDARCAVIIEDGEVVGAPRVEDIPDAPEKSSAGDTVKDAEPPKDLFSSLPGQ
jgi:AAA domain-containing protein